MIRSGSGLMYALHVIFQNQGIPPGITMGLRTANDPVPKGERSFMLASTIVALEDGETPVTVRNLAPKKKPEKK